MRVRHRVPQVFTLSMLDVFCCALGCVILLWLINQREAMMRSRDNVGLLDRLTASRSELQQLQLALAAITAERNELQGQTARLRGELTQANVLAKKTERELMAMTDKANVAADRLLKATDRLAILSRQADDAAARARELDVALRSEEQKLARANQLAGDLGNRVREAEAASARLRTAASMIPEMRESAAAASDRIRSLEAEREGFRAALARTKTEKMLVQEKLARAELASENRFEGIALKGQRVVFLVDMSGSMEMTDSQSSAPDKWAGVRNTLVKIFRSLGDLDKYQIILFSDQLVYPMGREGAWIDPDAQAIDRIQVALSSVRPKGNTNMYLALDAAFRYRQLGLDTIYLLSDGLPNVGEGLTPEAAARISETQRSEVLSRVVRSALRTTWNAPDSSRPRVRVNAVGFFYESPDVGAFLWALARENEGSFVGMSKP